MNGAATNRMLDRLAEKFTVHHAADGDVSAIVAATGHQIEYVLSNTHKGVPKALIEALPGLRIISNYGVGYDAVDTDSAVARGIWVTHTPDVLNDEVANTAVMLMLATARNLVQDDGYVRAGRWASEGNAPLSTSVAGRTVGLVGFGRIGQTIAEKLSVFGTRTVYHARGARDVPYTYFADLRAMAEASDILIVITPGGPGTRHLVNRSVIDALGPDGILINVARGSVVDQDALIAALQDGRLGKAGLDVFADEPHVPQALIDMEQVTLLPHVGSATVETRTAMGDLAVENLTAFLDTGRPVTPVPECQALG